ncbi:MAG TPA: S53 family peptidase [Terriglobales bacterium]|nr:S53 family peptidase [Terriglobales bacterium]
MNRRFCPFRILALLLVVTIVPGVFCCIASAQTRSVGVFNGHKIVYPGSGAHTPGRPFTNYFFVDSDKPSLQPNPGDETPGSLACVYQLVAGPAGCPISTSLNVPSGGIGAIAIVDAGYYPTAQSDLDMFDAQFGIPATTVNQVWTGKKHPPVYSDWEVEEALDIEWAHAMAPQAKLFLVVSPLCNSGECATDPTWKAITLAGQLVAQNGGGVVSMSFGDYNEQKREKNFDKYFTQQGVVYFSASGDDGLGVSFYPTASPNVVSVGGTYFNRDQNGKFINEVYGGGGGTISPYEPRPAYQNGIASIVGAHRGFPDVASDYCCAAIVLDGGWYDVGGTSWGTPTFAGIVNAAGSQQQSSVDELTMMYNEYANPSEYAAYFNDITQGASQCTVGWDICAGIGSPKTYVGK